MSFEAYKWVRDHSESRRCARLVLIAIADHCDGTGKNAWPAVSTLARETKLTERAVRGALRELVSLGELKISPPGGSRGSNVYELIAMTQGMKVVQGEEVKVVQGESESYSGDPLKVTALRGESYSSELILNLTNEPIHDPKRKGPVLPDWVPLDAWNGFLDHRKKFRPLPTVHALGLILKKLETLREQGHDPAAVLDQSVERGWKSVFPLHNNGGDHGYGNRPSLSERNLEKAARYDREHKEAS